MNLLFALQLTSCMMALMLAMQLLFFPYEGKEFKTYNKSRWMNFIAILLVAFQNIAQMVFKIRAQNETNGITCNLYFFLPACALCLIGMLNLQVAGNLKKMDYLKGIIVVVICYILLTAGLFINDGKYQEQANGLGTIGFVILLILYIGKIMKEYQKMVHNMDEYYGTPVEEYTKWMKTALILAFITFILVPICIISNEILKAYTILFWICISYYITRFIYFGHYAKYVEESAEEAIQSNEVPLDRVGTPQNRLITEEEQEKDLEEAIQKWVTDKGYCDSETTIIKLANEIGTNRTTLSRHINTKKGKTFREWINDYRIEEAKRLLTEKKDLSTEIIASQCGFSTKRYFEQVFANHEGKNIQQWIANKLK